MTNEIDSRANQMPDPMVEPVDGYLAASSELDDDLDDSTPARRVPRVTRLLAAAIVLTLAFTGGVLVQKRHDASLSSASGAAAAVGGSLPNFGGALPGATQGASNDGSSSQRATAPSVIGTVVSVEGRRIVVRDLGGTRHVVLTTGSTDISRSTQISATDLDVGTKVSVIGTEGSERAVTATAITTG